MTIKEIKPVANETILERFQRLSIVHGQNLQAMKIELENREKRRTEEQRKKEEEKPKCVKCKAVNLKKVEEEEQFAWSAEIDSASIVI